MGKYKEQIEKAKAAMTNFSLSVQTNGEGSLKSSSFYKELSSCVQILERFENARLFSKIKDALIIDADDALREEALKKIDTLTTRVTACAKCKCASCLHVSESCNCSSCITGMYVTKCDQNIEERSALPLTCYIEEKEIKRSVYDRKANRNVCTTVNQLGVEEQYAVDLQGNLTIKL